MFIIIQYVGDKLKTLLASLLLYCVNVCLPYLSAQVHRPLMGGLLLGCYIWYSEEGTGQAAAHPAPSSLYQM